MTAWSIRLAKFLYTVGDVKIIDGFHQRVGSVPSAVTSEQGRKLQTGYVQQYAFTMGFGMVVLLGLVLRA